MKKIYILLVIFSTFFLVSCNKVDNNNQTEANNDTIVNTGSVEDIDAEVDKEVVFDLDRNKLESIQIESTYSEEDVTRFNEEIIELENGDLSDFANLQNLARKYKYIGKTGKGILLYEDYLTEVGGSSAIYNNLAGMYDKLCIYNEEIHSEYCERAIYFYTKLVRDFIGYYKDISLVYIKMGDKDSAEHYYEKYVEKGGQKTSTIEKKLRELSN